MALTHYQNVKWPKYEYQEFPKWITPAEGAPVLVNSQEELDALGIVEAPTAEARVATLEEQIAELKAQMASMSLDADGVDERAELIGQAEAHGITIDRRWGVERLKAALAAV